MSNFKINKKIIEKLNPCKDRLDNFITNYPGFDSDLEEFIKLDKISYSDKVWVFTKLATKKQNVKWSILCAESVLHIFEEKFPEDKRPRRAIEAVAYDAYDAYDAAADAAEAARATSVGGASRAAEAAGAAAWAAEAAGTAAWAAWAAAWAVEAAVWATEAAGAVEAAVWATEAARAAAWAKIEQENKNLQFMLEAINE